MTTSDSDWAPRAGLAGKLLAAVATVLGLVAGILLLGRVAPGVTLAMLLTAAWFGVVAVVVLAAARRRRGLLLPMAAGYTVVAAAATVVLALPMFVDREVDEQVVTAEAAPANIDRAALGQDDEVRADRRPRRRNVLLGAGPFRPREHAVEGQASLVRLARGGVRLTLTGFKVDNGPDLRVHLVTGSATSDDDVDEVEDLGALKGNRGDQQYRVPARLDTRRYDTAVIWCRAFSVNFAAARLAGA